MEETRLYLVIYHLPEDLKVEDVLVKQEEYSQVRIPDTNVIESITIASTGNAQDFGDLRKVGMVAGLSDSHGGLGGF